MEMMIDPALCNGDMTSSTGEVVDCVPPPALRRRRISLDGPGPAHAQFADTDMFASDLLLAAAAAAAAAATSGSEPLAKTAAPTCNGLNVRQSKSKQVQRHSEPEHSDDEDYQDFGIENVREDEEEDDEDDEYHEYSARSRRSRPVGRRTANKASAPVVAVRKPQPPMASEQCFASLVMYQNGGVIPVGGGILSDSASQNGASNFFGDRYPCTYAGCDKVDCARLFLLFTCSLSFM